MTRRLHLVRGAETRVQRPQERAELPQAWGERVGRAGGSKMLREGPPQEQEVQAWHASPHLDHRNATN